ncbi:MAG: DUF1559 family PulG-like putative transporter [Planctomycetales bacterium]
MEHGFPPGGTVENVRETWLLHHAIMLSILAVVTGVHFLPARRLAQPNTLWLWSIILTLSPVVSVWVWESLSSQSVHLGGSPMRDKTFAGYMLLGWAVGFAGSIRTNRGAKKVGEYSRLADFHAYGNALCPIIGLFINSIPPPTYSAWGEAHYRIECRVNLRSIGRAVDSCLESTNAYPEATTGSPPTTWRIQLLRYLYGGKKFADYNPQSPWDSEENRDVSKQPESSLICRSSGNLQRRDDQGRCFTDFSMLTGPGTFAGDFKPRTQQGISDGASNTIAFVEASGLEIVWTEPRDALIGREPLGINLKGTGDFDSPGIMSAWHTGGAHATFADGSTRFLSQNIDPAVLKALTTVNGGESLPEQY